jgi:hypothetical protein
MTGTIAFIILLISNKVLILILSKFDYNQCFFFDLLFGHLKLVVRKYTVCQPRVIKNLKNLVGPYCYTA